MKTMEAVTSERRTAPNLTKALDLLARGILISLLFAILAAIFLAVCRISWDLRFLFRGVLVQGIKQVVISVVAVLALVEVYRTAYLYFAEGRVKVSYVVDTVLVVLMTDILSIWYAQTDYWRMSAAVVLLLTLGLIRLLAIRYSPTREAEREIL